MKLRILTMAWNKPYLDMFTKGCFNSLRWPKNKAALQGATWSFATNPELMDEAERLLFNEFDITFNASPMPETLALQGIGDVNPTTLNVNYSLLYTLTNEIRACLQTGSKLLLCPPDTLFGDGTIPNLLKAGEQIGTCVAVPHVRVLPSILDQLPKENGPVSNAQLVHLAFKNLHDSWVMAEENHPKLNSLIGGVHWKALAPDLFSVQHRLPTVYLAGLQPFDLTYFLGQSSFGAWDHNWPGERLVRQERQRTIGSSDSCFIVELTEAQNNVPPEVESQFKNPEIQDAYHMDNVHHQHNRLFLTTFRGEKLND